jgi:hypothetical protein
MPAISASMPQDYFREAEGRDELRKGRGVGDGGHGADRMCDISGI